MDFETYKTELATLNNVIKETNKQTKEVLDLNKKYTSLLKVVHGVYKSLSQAAQNEEKSFNIILDMNNIGWDLKEFEHRLRSFSFRFESGIPDEKGRVFETQLIGNDFSKSGLVVFRFEV